MLTTVDKVKKHLVMAIDTSKEALIKDLIKQVERNVENYCNRIFVYGTYIESYEAIGRKIFLKGFPVWSIEYVKVNGVEKTDYKSDLIRGIIYNISLFEVCNDVEVKYTCGYDAESIDETLHPPADLEGAIIEEVVSRYENFTSETRTGENLIDLRTNFLTSRARDYFSRQRIPNV